MTEKVMLHSAKFVLSQEPNCLCGNDCEEIEIHIEGSTDMENAFIQVTTNKWSFNDGDDAKQIFDKCMKAAKELAKEIEPHV